MPDADEGITYEMLQDLLRSERRTNKLMPLTARFWAKLREFLATINEAFRVEQARDPFSRDVMKLTDQVKNARHAAVSLWALRERKLAMLALAQQRPGKAPDGVTPEESELYQSMQASLQLSRDRVLPDLQAPMPPPGMPALPGVPPGATAPPLQVPVLELPQPRPPVAPSVHPAGSASSLVGVPPGGSASPTLPGATTTAGPLPAGAAPMPAQATQAPQSVTVPTDVKGDVVQMVTIRALGDIPAFVGPDMQTYLLKAGDIAMVPESIARLLERRKKAALIEA